jgi:hypothetical protein
MMTSDHRQTVLRLPSKPGTYWAYYFSKSAKLHCEPPPEGYNAVVVTEGKAPYMKARVWVIGSRGTSDPGDGDTLVAGPRIACPEMPEKQRVSKAISHDPQ